MRALQVLKLQGCHSSIMGLNVWKHSCSDIALQPRQHPNPHPHPHP